MSSDPRPSLYVPPPFVRYSPARILTLARKVGLGVLLEREWPGSMHHEYDGARMWFKDSERNPWLILHEIGHRQVAAPWQGRELDWGLGLSDFSVFPVERRVSTRERGRQEALAFALSSEWVFALKQPDGVVRPAIDCAYRVTEYTTAALREIPNHRDALRELTELGLFDGDKPLPRLASYPPRRLPRRLKRPVVEIPSRWNRDEK